MSERVEEHEETREELIEAFKRSRQRLIATLKGIPLRRMAEIVDGEWSIREIVVHIIAWDERSIADSRKILNGEKTDTSHLEDVDEFNGKAILEFASWSARDLLTGLRLSSRNVLNFMRGLSDEDLKKANRGLIMPTVSWMMDYSNHDIEHADQITAWRENNGL